MQSPLVLTITPNPSVDLLFEHERLVWDDANRTAAPRRRAGGQGINVARALHVLGGRAAVVALLGGEPGNELEHLLHAEGVPLRRVEAEADTRVFVAARERATGRSLLLNPRGPAASERSAAALCQAADAALAEWHPRWVACCGSVPPGIPLDLYARIGRSARAAGARFVADCDGELLRNAHQAGCDLLVPNQHEAARLTEREIAGPPQAAAAARQLRGAGVPVVCITLGAQGAVMAAADRSWHAAVPPAPTGSAVGAGDALLAALLLGLDRGDSPAEVLRAGVAAGSAVLKSEGGDLLTLQEYRRQYERVRVAALD